MSPRIQKPRVALVPFDFERHRFSIDRLFPTGGLARSSARWNQAVNRANRVAELGLFGESEGARSAVLVGPCVGPARPRSGALEAVLLEGEINDKWF